MAELAAEMVADMTLPRELELSSDGRQVAYALAPSAKRQEHPTAALWVAPTDGSRAPRRFTAGTANDRRPRWSPDGAPIAFLSDRAQRGMDALLHGG
ncbi:MAG TPA: S9 family peptidase, partial [Chloroflexota bacterium]|nr:S9 family peptidase [Chloroflexota bacterium]